MQKPEPPRLHVWIEGGRRRCAVCGTRWSHSLTSGGGIEDRYDLCAVCASKPEILDALRAVEAEWEGVKNLPGFWARLRLTRVNRIAVANEVRRRDKAEEAAYRDAARERFLWWTKGTKL